MPRPAKNRQNTDERASRRDSLDFRDWIYEPALVPLEVELFPDPRKIKILDQGEEGACTGFGLSAVINMLLRLRDGARADQVSPRMLYEMAKRHDRWPGESYDGSSARGCMKGWYKSGVCPEESWPYSTEDPGTLDDEARLAALKYPLGAFYRVLPKRSDLQAALHEVPAVFVTAGTHAGWDKPVDGLIEHTLGDEEQGGHAFAVIGYTEEGFLIQNSWNKDWGGVEFENGKSYPGCAIWSYEDFDRHLWDAWVARLGRPFENVAALEFSAERREEYVRGSAPVTRATPRDVIRDHFIHIDDGQFDPQGDYFTYPEEARKIIRKAADGEAKHILFYAHGGLNKVKKAARRVQRWRPVFKENGIYEIHFIWETGLWGELRDVLFGKQDFVEGRAGGLGNWKDRWFEKVTGPAGRGLWSEMRSDGELAFAGSDNAGSDCIVTLLTALTELPATKRPKLHLAGHSAGSIFLGHMLKRWAAQTSATGVNPGFETMSLFAPACTNNFFGTHIKPSLQTGVLQHLHHFHLDDPTERDDTVAKVYGKSLLYLVSRSYEKKGVKVPIMGMAKHRDTFPDSGVTNRISHYNPDEHPDRTTSKSHGGFDNDMTTMNSLLRLILPPAQQKRWFRDENLSGY
jgi:hypothetical protein